MVSQNNTFNKYTVYFKSNQPLTVWAKDVSQTIQDGVTIIKFIDCHCSTRIECINTLEFLYVRTDRVNVTLMD